MYIENVHFFQIWKIPFIECSAVLCKKIMLFVRSSKEIVTVLLYYFQKKTKKGGKKSRKWKDLYIHVVHLNKLFYTLNLSSQNNPLKQAQNQHLWSSNFNQQNIWKQVKYLKLMQVHSGYMCRKMLRGSYWKCPQYSKSSVNCLINGIW